MQGSTMDFSDIEHIGMVWYRFEDYDAIRRIMADRHKLPATFSEWRMKAEQKEKLERRNGKFVLRVFIDPETFPDWCRARGLDIDAQARHRFTVDTLADVVERTHGDSGGVH